MNINAYQVAARFVGIKEIAGAEDNPLIVGMLQRAGGDRIKDDETPWCSAFVYFIASLFPGVSVPASKKLRARSWLEVGHLVGINEARPGWDVVVLNRADGPADPTVIDAPGHVGFFSGVDQFKVFLLGGNQGNAVSTHGYDRGNILAVRRLYDEAG